MTNTKPRKTDQASTPKREQFIKSSFCGGGDCVEVAWLKNGHVLVRDAKDIKKAPLTFTPTEWTSFIKGVKAGEFDNE